MVKITKTAVVQALEEIVAELGEDYIYPFAGGGMCVYSLDGVPSCIVGQVIARLDPELFEEVRAHEEERGSSFGVSSFRKDEVHNWYGTYLGDLDDEYGRGTFEPILDAEEEAVQVLRIAQINQDAGEPYGKAVKVALEVEFQEDN